ncbi:unnamed protein product, partial [Didymodactylos carnosus]
QLYIANYDFNDAQTNGELSFRQQDKLEISDRHTYNEWWFAKNLRTGQSGYVPANYISPINDLTSMEWYFTDTNRRDAERFLEQPHNGKGTFLIRPSDSNQGQESLSVLDLSSDKHFHVKHYRIRCVDSSLYYINSKILFPTLHELVKYYQTKQDRLCCLLSRACPKIKPALADIDRHDLLELDRKQLEKVELLGKGNYGEVYHGKYGTRNVAIKYMKTDIKNRSSNVKKFLDEAKIMKDLNDKNIVRLYGVCTKEEPIFIVTEYMTNGCLLNYLRKHGKTLKSSNLVDFAIPIAKGMWYLEQRQFVHCDLAARNILVGEQNTVKIADFGLARVVQDGRLLVDRESQFPIKWMAPEAATKKEYTTKSDVWSYGILLYELITRGSNPYPDMNNNKALQAVLNGYRMPQPPDCPDSYYCIMSSCWQENPDNRPTFENLYNRFDDYEIQAEPNYRET